MSDTKTPRPDETSRRPRRRASWRVKLAALLLALGIGLGLAELGLRLFWHNSYRLESTEFMLPLKIQLANRDYIVERAFLAPDEPTTRLRTNDRSYILPAFQHEDPDATVAFLGGSTTECSIVREDLRFPALVSTLAGEKGVELNTLNAAHAGNTIHDSINVLLNHVVDDAPDVAVLMQATNDFGVLVREGDYRSRTGGPLDGAAVFRWFKQVVTRHVYLVAVLRRVEAGRRIRAIGEEEIEWRNSDIATLPLDAYRRRIHVFIDVCRDFGIEPVLMTQPLAGIKTDLTPAWANQGAQDRMNDIVREVASQSSVLLIDLARHLPTRPEWADPQSLLFDGMHVNDAGSRIYAEHITEKLIPLIVDLRTRK